jgi:hypothetical protein
MSYLAYDPTRIAALGAALHTALDELVGIRGDDPLAADAMGCVQHARMHLDQLWVPLVDRLGGRDPLGMLVPVHLVVDDLVDELMRMMRDHFGWKIAIPGGLPALPTGALPSAPPTAEEVTVLAGLLEHGDLDALTDQPEERAWLAAELTLIGADPGLATAFDAGFHRWGALADRLGHVRILTAASDGDVGDIDSSFLALATTYEEVHGSGSIPALTRTMEPYAAAALIRQAGLDPQTLAWLSVEVLDRLDGDRPPLWPEDLRPGPKTGDLLFETILATPGAATPFVIAVKANPQLLWWSAADPLLAQRVAQVGTDPANIDPVSAHLVLHAFVEWFDTYEPMSRTDLRYTALPKRSRAYLGVLAEPWFVEFGPGVDDWGPDAAGRRADLAFIVKDRGARDALLEGMGQEAAGLDGEPARHWEAEAVAQAIGMFLQVDMERKIRAGEDTKQAWDTDWKVIIKLISYSSKVVAPEAAPIVTMGAQALGLFKQLADATGWFGAPPPPGDVARQARAENQRLLLGLSATAVLAGYRTLVEDGRLPEHTPEPPVPDRDHPDDVSAYSRAYRRWKEVNDIAPGSDADLLLDEQFHLFLSDADVGARAG